MDRLISMAFDAGPGFFGSPGTPTFRALVADAPDRLHVIARFLAVLELYREALVTFEQAAPMTELHVRWVGAEGAELDEQAGEFDEELP